MLFPERYEPLDQRPPYSAAACFRRDEPVLKVADRLEAPGVMVEDIIGEPDWFVPITASEETPDRLIWRKNALPDPHRDLVRNHAIKGRAIPTPERKPSLDVCRHRWTDDQICRHGAIPSSSADARYLPACP
jgi:hypothetical protein